MANYKWITVRIPIEEGGALDQRIQAYCKAAGDETGETDVAVNAAVTGIVHHMNSNLELMERGLRNRGQA